MQSEGVRLAPFVDARPNTDRTTVRRPKVYIAAAFRKFSDWSTLRSDTAYGAITDNAYVRSLEDIESLFLDYGFTTCLPHRDEGRWGQVYYEPDAIGALCFRHVETSDVVFALAEDGRGVHLELGYAAGLGGKAMILMYKEGTTPSTLLFGLPGLANRWPDIGEDPSTVLVEYGDSSDLQFHLGRILADWFPERKERTSRQRRFWTHALIDIGSHTLKFQVQRLRTGRRPEVVATDRKSIGLLGSLDALGRLAPEAIDRVIAELKAWQDPIEALNADSVTVVGTAALRRASNAGDLVTRLHGDLGWQLEILDGDRELDYVYSAVMSEVHPGERVAVLNVGGGSTQIGVGTEQRPEDRIRLEFGTRHIVERWPWDGPLSDDSYEELLGHVRSLIASAIPGPIPVGKLVHTGGELDFLLRCKVPMHTSRFSASHVSEIATEDFAEFADQFRRLSRAEAARLFALDPAWAVGSVASNAIAIALAERLCANAIVPSNLNVSDGVAMTSVGAAPPSV